MQVSGVRILSDLIRSPFQNLAGLCDLLTMHASFRAVVYVQVVLLRTGVLMHIKKYMQTLGLLPLDIPDVPEKLQAAEPADEPGSEAEDEPADAGMLPCAFCACCRHLELGPCVPRRLVYFGDEVAIYRGEASYKGV